MTPKLEGFCLCTGEIKIVHPISYLSKLGLNPWKEATRGRKSFFWLSLRRDTICGEQGRYSTVKKKEKGNGLGYQASRTTPSDSFPPTSLCLLETTQPNKAVSPPVYQYQEPTHMTMGALPSQAIAPTFTDTVWNHSSVSLRSSLNPLKMNIEIKHRECMSCLTYAVLWRYLSRLLVDNCIPGKIQVSISNSSPLKVPTYERGRATTQTRLSTGYVAGGKGLTEHRNFPV